MFVFKPPHVPGREEEKGRGGDCAAEQNEQQKNGREKAGEKGARKEEQEKQGRALIDVVLGFCSPMFVRGLFILKKSDTETKMKKIDLKLPRT